MGGWWCETTFANHLLLGLVFIPTMGIAGCACLLGASLKTLARVMVLTGRLPEAPWLPEGWTGV